MSTNLFTMLGQVSDLTKAFKDGADVANEIQHNQPVSLDKIAADFHLLLNDFAKDTGAKIPPEFDNVDTILLFLEGGINNVRAHAANNS